MKTQGSTARVEEFRMILCRLNALPGWRRSVALVEVAALVYWLAVRQWLRGAIRGCLKRADN